MPRDPVRNSLVFFSVLIMFLILAVAFAARAQVSRTPIPQESRPAVTYDSGSIAQPDVTFSVYPVSGNATAIPGITTGSDGALWFTSWNSIWRLTTAGAMTEYRLPDDGVFYPLTRGATHITTGPDGALWFTESIASKIGRITTAGE